MHPQRNARKDRFFAEGLEVSERDFWAHLEAMAAQHGDGWTLRKQRVTRWNLTPKGRAAAEAYRRERGR
jgi:hypothetical protein